MTTNPINAGSFLRTQRNFPTDIQALTVELDKSYVDIAAQVNNRTCGIYGTSTVITGESWYLEGGGQRQQTLRRVYQISSDNLTVPHMINFASVSLFTRIYGSFFDGTNYWPLPYVDVVAANNQISLEVTPTNLVVLPGGGSPPPIVYGVVVLEWLSQFSPTVGS